MSAWGADVEWHVVGPSTFDLAVMGRASFAAAAIRTHELPDDHRAFSGIFFQAPLLASITVGSSPVTVLDGAGRLTQGCPAGFGVRWQITPRFALHPEASYLDDIAGPSSLGVAMVGVGIVLGP